MPERSYLIVTHTQKKLLAQIYEDMISDYHITKLFLYPFPNATWHWQSKNNVRKDLL